MPASEREESANRPDDDLTDGDGQRADVRQNPTQDVHDSSRRCRRGDGEHDASQMDRDPGRASDDDREEGRSTD